MIKLIAVDVDGTLTNKDGTINLDSVKVLRGLKEKGIEVMLATGRSIFETYTLSKFLGFANFGIGENGGVIYYKEPTRVKLFGNFNDALYAYEYLSREFEGIKINQRMPRLTEILLERNFDKEAANKLLNKIGFKVLDSGIVFHLSSLEINKGVALRYLCESLKIKKEEVASIGDSEVDVPMFKVSGYAFLVNKNFQIDEKELSDTKLIKTKTQGPEGVIEAVEWLMNNDLIQY